MNSEHFIKHLTSKIVDDLRWNYIKFNILFLFYLGLSYFSSMINLMMFEILKFDRNQLKIYSLNFVNVLGR